MAWEDRIVSDPELLTGKPVIRGTRIGVDLILDLLERGYSREDILGQYPDLAQTDIQACLAYAKELLRSEHVFALPG